LPVEHEAGLALSVRRASCAEVEWAGQGSNLRPWD
jgi:hypothetical protein